MNSSNKDKLIQLRRFLHQNPELSGNETMTAKKIKNFIEDYNPDEVIESIGGEGLAFIFNGKKAGKTLMLRADLDALPICEKNTFSHKSVTNGVSHKCGHDGHMAILSGVATQLQSNRVTSGKLVLLFQPSEENGQGAKSVIEDEKFKKIYPDYVFALHNLPGLPQHSIAIKEKHITSASTGMKIRLVGKTAHAMSPQDGISPVEAIKKIHDKIDFLYIRDRENKDFSLITTVGIHIGAEDYGVATANDEIYLTVRAYKNAVLENLLSTIKNISTGIADSWGLKITFSYKDYFPATVNDKVSTNIIKKAVANNQLQLIELSQCMGFSEDFGRFIEVANKGGAFFLLGCGENHHALHTPEYDFNDEIIADGINMFSSIIEQILGFEKV